MSSYATAFSGCVGVRVVSRAARRGAPQAGLSAIDVHQRHSHIFLARIARSKAALDSLTAALKKLDSATSRLESAQSKVQNSKKEKRELEEELRLAKAAYDDAVTDVEARSEAIQDSEYDDWQCLTTYMQAQLDYMGQRRRCWNKSSRCGARHRRYLGRGRALLSPAHDRCRRLRTDLPSLTRSQLRTAGT